MTLSLAVPTRTLNSRHRRVVPVSKLRRRLLPNTANKQLKAAENARKTLAKLLATIKIVSQVTLTVCPVITQ